MIQSLLFELQMRLEHQAFQQKARYTQPQCDTPPWTAGQGIYPLPFKQPTM